MKKIKLSRNARAISSSCRLNPIYALESNYCFTKKYSRLQRTIYKASVTVLLFSDRVTLIPESHEGARIIGALKEATNLKINEAFSFAHSIANNKSTSVSYCIDRITSLLSHFDADDNFGLYGFFTYELINMKLGVDVPDAPLGIFYFP